MIIYYNSRCSKCREALTLLESAGCEVEIRNYLQDVPDLAELQKLLGLLGCKAEDLLRKDEEVFRSYREKKLTELQLLKLMVKHPVLIQRPVVISGKSAVIGRPPSLVLDLVKKKITKTPSPSAKQKSPPTK
jgi:arsenate reductase (glutaredoxin)